MRTHTYLPCRPYPCMHFSQLPRTNHTYQYCTSPASQDHRVCLSNRLGDACQDSALSFDGLGVWLVTTNMLINIRSKLLFAANMNQSLHVIQTQHTSSITDLGSASFDTRTVLLIRSVCSSRQWAHKLDMVVFQRTYY